MKGPEISGVPFASCSNASKRGKKCDEFKFPYQNILKLLFCGHISLLQTKTKSLQIPPHMGKRYAILAKVPYWQCTCPSPSAHLLETFGHGSKSIPQLKTQTLKYNSSPNATCKIWWNITKDTGAGAPAVNSVYSLCFEIYSFLSKHPLRKKWPSSDFCFFSAFFHKISSDVSRNMLKIQTESYFHLTMSKWPISTAKL